MGRFAAIAGAVCMVAWCTSAGAEPIGQAESATNVVTGVLGALTRSIATGDSVSGNETVKTGSASAALLRFLDNSNLTIGEASTVVLDKFVFNPDSTAKDGIVKLTKGAMRFVSGGPEPKNFAISTPVATLGVRGTDFVVICDGIRCVVLMSTGIVKVCPHRLLPVDCRGAYSLDQDKNFTLVGPNGENSGPGRIDGSVVAAVIAAIAGGQPSPNIGNLASLASVHLDAVVGPKGSSIDAGRISASPQ